MILGWIKSKDWSLNDEGFNKVIEYCLKEKLILQDIDGYTITSGGLLLATKSTVFDKKLILESNENKRYFNYTNKSKVEMLSVPRLSFDTDHKNNITENSYRVYKTEIKRKNLGTVDILLALENLLYKKDETTDSGSWILKFGDKSICGFSLENIRAIIEGIDSKQVDLKVAFPYDGNVILVCDARSEDLDIKELTLRFYISNYLERPYIDTLKSLNKRLCLFLNFIDCEELPIGREIEITGKKYEIRTRSVMQIKFVADKLDVYREKSGNIYTRPEFMVISSKIFEQFRYLGRSSPWFVTCRGGFDDREIEGNRAYKFWMIKYYELEETGLLSIMLDAVNWGSAISFVPTFLSGNAQRKVPNPLFLKVIRALRIKDL
jgi:hypothetical protein